MGTDEGVAWTLERFRDHNGKDAHQRKGLRTLPFFDCVPIDHYVVSTLHLEIGAIKNVYDHMVSKAQAACEGYMAR